MPGANLFPGLENDAREFLTRASSMINFIPHKDPNANIYQLRLYWENKKAERRPRNELDDARPITEPVEIQGDKVVISHSVPLSSLGENNVDVQVVRPDGTVDSTE